MRYRLKIDNFTKAGVEPCPLAPEIAVWYAAIDVIKE
jgi:hypothetical protein